MSIITHIALPALNAIPLANKCLFIYKKHPVCRSPHQLNFLSVLAVLLCLYLWLVSGPGWRSPSLKAYITHTGTSPLQVYAHTSVSPVEGASWRRRIPPPPAHLPKQSSAAMAGRRRCSSAPSSGRCRAAPPLQHPARGQRPSGPARPPRKAQGGTRGSGAGAAAAAGEAELRAHPGRLRAFFFPPPSGGSSPSLSLRPELPLLHLLHPSHLSPRSNGWAGLPVGER